MLKIIKNNKIVNVVEVWSDQDKRFHPNVEIVEDNTHKPSDYTNIGEEFVLNNDYRAIKYKQDKIREIRNSYLIQYIDPIVSNPLRWADLTEEEKQKYTDYRRYLLDYTQSEDWWLINPQTFDVWIESQEEN